MATQVLVVDDEPKLVEVVVHMLKRHGYEVRTAGDGEEALKQIEERIPDVVLLDVMMPKMDGTTVAEKLKENPLTAKVPIVFVTSLVAGDELAAEGDQIGGHLFLAKPFSLLDLVATIDKALGQAP